MKFVRPPDRVPAGKHQGFIKSVEIVNLTSKKGVPYKGLLIHIIVMHKGFPMTIYFRVPLFFNDENGPLVKLAKKFEIYPEVGEEFHYEKFLLSPVSVKVKENTFNGKIYSNVEELDILEENLNPLLQQLLDEQKSLNQKAMTVFDDDNEVVDDEEDDHITNAADLFDSKTETSLDGEEENPEKKVIPKFNFPRHSPQVNQGFKKRPPVSPSNQFDPADGDTDDEEDICLENF